MNIEQFWKAVLAQDEREIRKYFHAEAYVNWHCTNEHFTVDEYIVGNTKEDKVLLLIIKYPPVFAAFPKRIIKYYSVPCKQNS